MKDIFNWSRTNNWIGFLLTSSEYQNFALSATSIQRVFVLLHLGLEGITEVDTDPKGSLCPLRLFPLMTEFSVFMPLQGIVPGDSWLGGISLKDY